MKKHADILRPKFESVEETLEKELTGLAEWTKPKGGYFISLTVKGIAEQVVKGCKEAGVILTPAGSAYPYRKDPENANIRIAPSFPSLSELKIASEILCLCVKIERLKQELN